MTKTREIEANTMGGRLRAGRAAKKLTLQKIGKHLGVSAQAVSQWEYGEALPSVDKLCVLVQLLELHVDEVLGMTSNGHSKLSELSDRLEQVLEVLPTAQGAIIDTSVNRSIADGFYIVRLRKGDRSAVLGRLVWPKTLTST
jgi:transcriptional regulator with XRE-family HTH domain